MEQQNIIIEGIHYATKKVIRIGIRNGMIFSLADIDEKYWPGENAREKLPVIAPGLVDLQINGFLGVDFNSPGLTPEQISSVSSELLKHGVTRYFPTIITGSGKRTSGLLGTFAKAVKEKSLVSQMIGGIHLEGPFISSEDGPRGAHPGRYCRDPDISLVERWQEEADGKIRLITLAPELPGCLPLIEACVNMGIIVAIGHTSAGSRDIRLAVDAGATLSTHLGNGAHGMLPRHPNYIWDQLAEDRLYASMIADEFHLPDSVIKVFMRAKKEKAILISDGMPFAGLEPGPYESPATGKIILTEEGKLHKAGNPGIMAGSASTLLEGIRRIREIEDFVTAWDMGSAHPARLLNHSSSYGLKVGAPADLVLLDHVLNKLKVLQVYKNGVNYTFGNST